MIASVHSRSRLRHVHYLFLSTASITKEGKKENDDEKERWGASISAASITVDVTAQLPLIFSLPFCRNE